MFFDSEILLFTIFYLLMCGCIVYPPVEFVSSGLTISSLFSPFLKSENEQFVLYHVKRSAVTLLVYSLLPLGYIVSLWFFNYSEEILSIWTLDKSLLWQLFTNSCFIFPLLALYQIKTWSHDNWKNHPIANNLSKFCNNNDSWLSVASDINAEFRRIDKICIQTNVVCKVVATENWIMKVAPLTIFIAHQSDTSFKACQSDTHFITLDNARHIQFLTIEVKSSRPNVQPFNIRVNTLDFKDLQDRLARPISLLPNILVHRSLLDKFIDTFKEVIQENPLYRTGENLENCIGCLQKQANVKLQKICESNSDSEGCITCYCRPMWCAECMARWFASRQDSERPDTWLSSKCTCPMCRSTFCILDVCLIESN